MTRGRRKLLLSILLLGTSSTIFGQSLDQKLRQDCATYDSDKRTTLEQLVELAQRFQLPMGIEWVDRPNETTAKPIHLRNVNVKEVISHVLNEQAGYRFAVEDLVVQVSATELADDPLNFLNIRFSSYSVKNDSLLEASYWLRVWIRRSLHPAQNFGGGFGGTSAQGDFNNPTITFSVTNASVRQILNRLVLAQRNSLWVVHLKPQLLMDGEPFYAQAVSPTTGKGLSEFTWAFIPLSNNLTGRTGSDLREE
jgi:hypothetical protein